MSRQPAAPAEVALADRALNRRRLFAGAGTAGALAAAAAVLPLSRTPEAAVAEAAPAAEPTGGYQVTEHVTRYYQTARV